MNDEEKKYAAWWLKMVNETGRLWRDNPKPNSKKIRARGKK